MIVIDTSALIAIFSQQEDEATAFTALLFQSDRRLIGAPTKFELLLVASRRPQGTEIARALLNSLGCEVASWTDVLSDIAIDAFLRYGKGRHPAALNFGDCMAYALAKSLDAPLLFKGGDFRQTDIRPAL